MSIQIEESLALLAESAEEGGLTPEIEAALTAYLQGAVEKRDRVAEFIHFCEAMAELAKAEVKRRTWLTSHGTEFLRGVRRGISEWADGDRCSGTKG
jgi:hypothetical protein